MMSALERQPSAVKGALRALAIVVVLWIAMTVCLHALALVGYEYQGLLTHWGWPLMVAAAGALLLAHKKLDWVLHVLIPIAVIVSSWNHVYAVAQARLGGPWAAQVDTVKKQLTETQDELGSVKAQLGKALAENGELKHTVAAAKPVADQAVAAAAACEAKKKAKGKGTSTSLIPPLSDFTNWLPMP